MPFRDWLRRRSARRAAHELGDLHRHCGGDYTEVMRLSLAALVMATAQGTVSKKHAVILEAVLTKSIRNYVDLCVLFLYVNSASKRQTCEDICAGFADEVRHWLLAEGLPHRYVADDNRERTNGLVDALREGLGFQGLFPDS